MNFTKEVQQLISKSLPEATANEMKKFIDEAKNTEENFEVALKTIKSQEELLKNREATIDQLLKYKQEVIDCDEREIAQNIRALELEEMSRNQNMTMLNAKLENAEKLTNVVITLVDKVFGHPNVTIQTQKDVVSSSSSSYNPDGSSTNIVPVTTPTEETTTTTESKA